MLRISASPVMVSPIKTGLGLAAISGALTSGVGYAIWYVALKDLSTSRAAIVQLTVPVLTAAGGVILLGEPMTWRLVLAAAAILGGIALALLSQSLPRSRQFEVTHGSPMKTERTPES